MEGRHLVYLSHRSSNGDPYSRNLTQISVPIFNVDDEILDFKPEVDAIVILPKVLPLNVGSVSLKQ